MIVKYVNGEKKIIAEKSIIDHSQLSGKEAYGCHPISAIRNLPEKLHSLKEKQTDFETQLSLVTPTRMNEFNSRLTNAITAASGIALTEENGLLTFKDYAGSSTSFRSGHLVDNDTVQIITDENEVEKLALKKVYTDETITGLGIESSPLSIATVKAEIDGRLDTLESNDTSFENEMTELNSTISAINIKDEEQDASIQSLRNTINAIQGIGGYLTANTFGANPSQNDLFNYAIQELGIAKESLPDGLKVKNLTDNIIWILNTELATPAWINNGIESIAIASSETAGIVKSSDELYQIAVNDTIGTMYVNGLANTIDRIDGSITTLETAKEDNSNKVTEISASSTDSEYPSAKAVYDYIQQVLSNLSNE